MDKGVRNYKSLSDIRLLIFQRILPHYRTDVFRRFARKFRNLTVVFGDPCRGESLSNDDPEMPEIFVRIRNHYPLRSPKVFFSELSRIITAKKPDVIISVFNVGNLNLYRLFLLRRVLGFRLILWSFGYDPQRGFEPGKSISDKIRLKMCLCADAVIFYWQQGKEEIERVSGRRAHFFVAPNTLDTVKLLSIANDLESAGRNTIKKELGVKEDFHFVYVGRLLEDKQIDLLIKAFGLLTGKIESVRLTIIGDGPERKKLEELAKESGERIVFEGEILDEVQTGRWIFISNAFIMPGRLGLSVVHSFCFGTPVISQKKESYFHGEGIGYLKDGFNGLLSRDGDIADLAEKMSLLAGDAGPASGMRANCKDTVKDKCSVDKMISGFEEAIAFALSRTD